jgi:hypothetical protein
MATFVRKSCSHGPANRQADDRGGLALIIISYNNFREGVVVAKSDMPLAAVQEPAGLMYSG